MKFTRQRIGKNLKKTKKGRKILKNSINIYMYVRVLYISVGNMWNGSKRLTIIKTLILYDSFGPKTVTMLGGRMSIRGSK